MVAEGDLLESQLVFRFKDGSLHDEKVAFSQQRVFTLISYRLVQRGPSFPEQLDVSIDRGSAQYTVRSQRGAQGKEAVQSGQFDLPKDVYNGMLIMVSKNLPKGADETVSVLAFTPAPQVVPVQLHAIAEQSIQIGDRSGKATQFVFTPQLGMMQEWLRTSGVELRGAGVDESPHCYKRLTDVLAEHAGSIKILHTLTPIGVAMASEKEFDPYKD
jgi:hypothetical protein